MYICGEREEGGKEEEGGENSIGLESSICQHIYINVRISSTVHYYDTLR